MCCDCCSATQRKIWVFGLGVVFAGLGVALLIFWPALSLRIMHNNLVLKKGSEAYDSWVEAPIPIFLEFHMFNWTNPDQIRNPNVKPNFVEMGPYVFSEKHFKENITFYPNDTVSYFEKRVWHFVPELSNGTLEDQLTAAHVISATVAEQMRHKFKPIKKVINFILNHEGGMLAATKPVGEWIFTGYQDDLTDFLNLFNTSKIHIPYTRFGWLADRNGSAEYDGLFTIHTGVDDISELGSLTHWNRRNESGFYDPPCGTINGTTGDLFAPHMDTTKPITIYATDACRYMNLMPSGTHEQYGIVATKYMGTEETLDSGVNYPNQKCFCSDVECPKAGVVETKKCRDKAPIYVSFPHFNLADRSYVDAVSGVKPDPIKHAFEISIEPYTGIPLKVNARFQINMLLQADNDYDIYRGIQTVLMPMFWFEQRATLDKKLANRAKLVINLEDYGSYLGIALTSLGGLLLVIGIVLTITKRWKRIPNDDEDMLTNENASEPNLADTLPRTQTNAR